MNKQELVQAVSREIDERISQDKIRMILNTAVDIISRTLDEGEPVKWQGFGSLVPKEIPPRRYFSPAHREYMVSEESKRVVFAGSAKKNRNNTSPGAR